MKDEYITLIPTPVTNNTVQWTMIHNGSIGQGKDYPNIDLPNDGQSKIEFKILDLSNTKITFDSTVVDPNSNPEALNAIWIAVGSGNQKKAGPYPGQINQVKLQDYNKNLIVKDKNSDDAVLTYQLNFKAPQGSTLNVPPIDPEIRNGGGGGIHFNLDAIAVALGLITLALVGLLWIGQRRSSRMKAQSPQASQRPPA
jgi:hypothetical protein